MKWLIGTWFVTAAPQWVRNTFTIFMFMFVFFFFLFLWEGGYLVGFLDGILFIIVSILKIIGDLFLLMYYLLTGACGTPGVCA